MLTLRSRKRSLIILLTALSTSTCLLLIYGTSWSWSSRKPDCSPNNEACFGSWTLHPGNESRSCKFPRLEAVNDEITPYLGEEPPPNFNCSTDHPMRFRTSTTYGNQIVPVLRGNGSLVQGEFCCYNVVARDGGGPLGTRQKISNKCFPVSLETSTDVPARHEFVYLQCGLPNNTMTYEDMFAFVHPKKRKIKADKIKKNEGRSMMNILILGLDSQSRLNFLRTMPLSSAFLLQNLSAVPLKGYTKLGDNSLPNLIPLLTGLSLDELTKTCWPSMDTSPFDECPFIWKDFAKKGYLTSFSEDGVWMGLFNYHMQGFLRPPTDYYLHHLMALMDEKIGHQYAVNANLCYGPRLGFEVLLDHAVKTAVTLGRNGDPYFQFVWANSLFHDYTNYAKLGDELLFQTLKYLQENGYLANTLLIVLGDHGMRWGEIRLTFQGKIEEKMPLAYLAFPPKFRKRYRREIAVLKENGENRLTTHFDTYATLAHVLQLQTKRGQRQRKGKGQRQGQRGSNPRGISLLKSISKFRTCREAGIDEFNCVCNYVVTPLLTNDTDVLSASFFVVEYINTLLEEAVPGSKCASLMLSNITEAVTKEIGESVKSSKTLFQLTFVTVPGGAIFESTLSRSRSFFWGERWDISGVNRLDSYHKQSECIKNRKVKKYCFCL